MLSKHKKYSNWLIQYDTIFFVVKIYQNGESCIAYEFKISQTTAIINIKTPAMMPRSLQIPKFTKPIAIYKNGRERPVKNLLEKYSTLNIRHISQIAKKKAVIIHNKVLIFT